VVGQLRDQANLEREKRGKGGMRERERNERERGMRERERGMRKRRGKA
jgi:hypothetical protein